MSSEGATPTERLFAAARQNNRDYMSKTALMNAAGAGAIDCLKVLLEQPAISLELRDQRESDTALLYACKSTSMDDEIRKACVQLLLQAGANPSARDRNHQLPEDLDVGDAIKKMLQEARIARGIGAGDVVDDDDDDDDSDDEPSDDE
ncbi:hypothetical protein BDF19DRAFT_449156 [Syncephalis fuscata]|nr:hypothetical protein BDF19DRAFT_449156 [Syncephalis fuscata]